MQIQYFAFIILSFIIFEITGQTCSSSHSFTNPSDTLSSSQGYCNYIIPPNSPTSVTKLTFSEFYLSAGEYLQVLFNEVVSYSLTGQTVPVPIVAPPGNRVSLNYSSLSSNSGWSLQYQIYGCHGRVDINQPYGTISDGSGNLNYQDSSNCTWIIHGTPGKKLAITFSSFELIGLDFLIVYEGPENSRSNLGKFNGNTLPPKIVASDGVDLIIQFKKDSSNNGAGWELTYGYDGIPITTAPITTAPITTAPITTGVPLPPPVRKDVFTLTASEILSLRTAFEGIMALPATNPNSYYFLAAIHGGGGILDRGYCVHNDPGGTTNGFVLWHRVYLQKFENALQTIVPGIKIPYWNWFTKNGNNYAGYPPIFTEQTYVDAAGAIKPNPLLRARARNGGFTQRKTPLIGSDDDLENMRDVETSQATNWGINVLERVGANNEGFDESLRQRPHNTLHTLIGGPTGDMTDQTLAAYDPIFWVHHANIDRLWASWQRMYPNVRLSTRLLGQQLLFPNNERINMQNAETAPEYDRLEIFNRQRQRNIHTSEIKMLKVHVQSMEPQIVTVTVRGERVGHIAIFGSREVNVHEHEQKGEIQLFDISRFENATEKDVDIIPQWENVAKPPFTVSII